MKYPDTYIQNHDIDWFCTINGFYIHVASAGGKLPQQINDKERLRIIQNRVANLPDIYTNDEIVYNEQFFAYVPGLDIANGRDAYVESFAAMARKGFVSFDRTEIGNADSNIYHWVCRPRNLERAEGQLANIGLVTFNRELVITEQEPVGLFDKLNLLSQILIHVTDNGE